MTETTTTDLQSMSFVIEGDVNVQITITEQISGDLQFDLVVLDDTGSIGDLNGLFFDLVDPSIVDGLMVEGTDVTAEKFDEGSVDNLGGGVTVKGELTQDEGFDAGVRFGTSGMAKDDIQETSFTLSHDSLDLMIDDFFGSDFGVRLTSVGEEDSSREDSLKLGGTAPEEVIVDEEPPVDSGDDTTDPNPDGDTPPPVGPEDPDFVPEDPPLPTDPDGTDDPTGDDDGTAPVGPEGGDVIADEPIIEDDPMAALALDVTYEETMPEDYSDDESYADFGML